MSENCPLLLPMHYMTQNNQPYGSVRKCCEICGRAAFIEGYQYTEDRGFYNNHPNNCKRLENNDDERD